jgi:hypothetical protein
LNLFLVGGSFNAWNYENDQLKGVSSIYEGFKAKIDLRQNGKKITLKLHDLKMHLSS